MPEAINGIPNAGILRSSMSQDEQKAILSSVFMRPTKKPDSINELQANPHTKLVRTLEPVVFVSGNHMSNNPMPGVGVSRSIRLRFPHAHITAVESRIDNMSGRNDVTFDKNIALHFVLDHKKGEKNVDLY